MKLLQFQRRALVFCQRVGQLGGKLAASAAEASVSLQDDVSQISLHRIESIADKLVSISGYGQQELTAALKKTCAELERWNDM